MPRRAAAPGLLVARARMGSCFERVSGFGQAEVLVKGVGDMLILGDQSWTVLGPRPECIVAMFCILVPRPRSGFLVH